ncbi:MAG: alanine--tRNA ligase [Gammaproteobacteria bacterium]|nr:alanine--tRNA ligase [Gammaproteobacteria bacterium]
MKSIEIRQAFLEYFYSKGHEKVTPGPLVPTNDKTLLFTNAGMVQFKELFLGLKKAPYAAVTTCQPCIRAGGKHNDLENVGYTARHHTLFEMLGNFSFGSYDKRQAITYAWELLTEVFKLPAEKLWISVFREDDEAERIWREEIGIAAERLSRCGEEDNFWRMGDTGPCGPCSEIFYDHGPEIAGGPPGSADAEGDRYIEIWNLVFMQYQRTEAGELLPLEKLCVDTGMGLERIAAVLQGVHNNYDTDLFQPIFRAVAQLAYVDDLRHHSLRVIADHMRSTLFLTSQGVFPANEGRGYVLRRIIRRALRHGYQLGLNQPFLYKLVESVIASFGDSYPELAQQRAVTEPMIKAEEEQFARTLDIGMRLLERALKSNDLTNQQLPGELVFKLYDTCGFPLDLTADIARERGFTLDTAGFEHYMNRQRQLSKSHSQFKMAAADSALAAIKQKSQFIGYEQLCHQGEVIALFANGQAVETLAEGEEGIVVLEQTPFYPEGGGQVGDSGILQCADGRAFYVDDTQRQNDAILHYGRLNSGQLTIGDHIEAKVDQPLRQATVLNHTATHLLHAALRDILGFHVMQKGSLVEPAYLRFDFTHAKAVSKPELERIEALINQHIRANHAAKLETLPLQQAVEQGALALFDEKYNDKEDVRVLTLSDFSKELCGGTHAKQTGDIGLFKITSESAIAAGIRRIEAVTGEGALKWLNQQSQQQSEEAHELKSQLKETAKRVDQLQQQLHQQIGISLADGCKKINNINIISSIVKNSNAKLLRIILDCIKIKLDNYVVVLATIDNDRVSLVVGVDKALTEQLKANELASQLAQRIGGKAGGHAEMAQGGGTKPDCLPQALSWLEGQVRDHLN